MGELQKRTRDGKRYVRPPRIESSISMVLALDRTALHSRAAIRNRSNPNYIPSEVLVHLIRKAFSEGDRDFGSSLLGCLLLRCRQTLKRLIWDSKHFDANVKREEILGDFSELVATDIAGQPKLDFYEARFDSAFQKFAFTRLPKQMRFVQAEVARGEDLEVSEDAILSEAQATQGMAAGFEELTPTEKTVDAKRLAERIRSLPEKECETVVLYHLCGHTQEEVAALCGVTDRTIRERLASALEKIPELKEYTK